MSTATRVGTAMVAGYVLGRTKKLKLAISVGGMLVGQRIATNPRALLKQGQQLVESNPELAKIEEQLRGKFMEAARAAALATVSSRMDQLSDSLQQRSSGLRSVAGELEPGGDEESEQPEDAAEDEELEEEPESDEQEEPEAEADEEQEPEEEAEERPRARRGRPAKKAPARKAPAKKAPAKKAAAKKSAARQAPAKRTAAAKSTTRKATTGSTAKKTAAKKTAAKKTAKKASGSRSRR